MNKFLNSYNLLRLHQEDMEHLNRSLIIVEETKMIIKSIFPKTTRNWAFIPQKTRNCASMKPRNATLGIYPGAPKAHFREAMCMFITPVFTLARIWKQHEGVRTDNWIKKMMCLHSGILLSC